MSALIRSELLKLRSTRTNFALLYCMRQMCHSAKYTAHPQCQRMRLNDEQ